MGQRLKTKRQSFNNPLIRGIVRVNSRAVGFIGDEKQVKSIRIETENLNTALNRDEVEVQIIRKEKNVRTNRQSRRPNAPQTSGRVIRILKRAKTQFVGTIEPQRQHFALMPDDFRMYAPIIIQRPPRDAAGGVKALVRLTEWKLGKEPVGEIIKILGAKGDNETEMQSIALEQGFESSFPQDAEREAEKIAEDALTFQRSSGAPFPDYEIRKRRDFRKHILFTIDPKNAQDFDDALSFRKIFSASALQNSASLPAANGKPIIGEENRYEIGIHIADVSHYVREGTLLDREARGRGTSVYLVDRTIPMLPQILSNDLCSLKPNADRLAFSAVFEMNANGKTYKRWFGKSIIRSQRRFTYESAQEILNAKNPRRKMRFEDESFREALGTLNLIAKRLRAEKIKKGAIDFESEEVGFELDKNGHPLRVFRKERLDTHKLVEEFMLLANREVAEFLWRTGKENGMSFIYRIHDVPDSEKISQLRVFVRALGHELPIGKGGRVRGKDLQALFQKIEGKAEESLIKTAAIRSMAKAVYSTKNIGHFGLAFEYYTHFTSPIRRYPDLIAHRLLESVLKRHSVDPERLAKLERIADETTQREIAAAEAERESIKLKQVEFMQEFIGKEFDGIISGVTEWGIYIEESQTKAEGMVKLRDISEDYFILDEKNYRLVGKRTKKKYSLGDKVRFTVTAADPEQKILDYANVRSFT